MRYDGIIIGGGAAGLFCAITAGRRGRRVLVIEHNAEVGRKVIISGGGRCNFTNIDVRPENFVSQNPHFCKSALAGYTPQDFISLVETHGIAFYEKTLGQLFCRESSRQIVDMLLSECRRSGVEIITGCTVARVARDDAFRVETDRGTFEGRKLVVACGGLSFPKIGASGFGYALAQQFGLRIVETRPSLVGLVLSGQNHKSLAGISINANVSVDGQTFRENILFTHRGLSGPAVIQISNYWLPEKPVSIDLLPETNVTDLVRLNSESGRKLVSFFSELLPQRFAELYIGAQFGNKPLADLSKSEIEGVGRALNTWQVQFAETEGYGRAEVTLGGVSTAELSSQTMEAKKCPGLYFIGEVVDVTGWLGGYNFQWAWSSGFAAGSSI